MPDIILCSYTRLRRLTTLFLFCMLAGFFFSPGFVRAQTPGVSAGEIVIGQSCALEGPAQALGKGMRDGALAYFKHINASGGVHGKKLRLITYDDGYEPKACAANTKKLIRKDKVFLLFGYVGTPTSKAAAPIAAKNNVPYFAPFTGAEFLRAPLIREVFNIRASYFQETEAMVHHLITDKNIKRISVFFQNDSYGKAGLAGVRKALDKRDMKILNEAHYPRNTLDVDQAVKALLMTKPDAIIMIGAYAPCAKFIQVMREARSEALFLNVSFVGGDAMGRILANEGLGVVVTQVVPYPYDRRVPIVEEYNRLSGKAFPGRDMTFPGMEGFIAAKALCTILEKTPAPITREGFIRAAETMSDVDLGGFTFSFSPTNHQGSDLVYFTQVGPGGFIAPIIALGDLYQYNW
ncbi:MAG: ABC transporter substrate-binding protein [Desulfobacterales bacterium]|nr:ABC transporter substrate-binding protein [Desulfobacterales bacterium]